MTRMMNAAYVRVGEERYAKNATRRTLREERYAKNAKTYGIATLRRKHLRMAGDTLVFECTGA